MNRWSSLRGKPGRPRDWVYVQFEKKWFVRNKNWKLHKDGRFFDMQRDPFELAAPIAEEVQTDKMTRARNELQTVANRLYKR